MNIQLEFSFIVGISVTVLGAFWAMAKLLLLQSQKHIDRQFAGISATLRDQDEGTRRIERELLELKAELPRDYVRREDQNRVIASMTCSLDNLRLTIERHVVAGAGKGFK